MKDKLETLLSFLQRADTLEAFQSATERTRDYYGVSHVVYHWVNSNGERFGAGTYSGDWVDRYLEMDYLRMDPVIFGCFQRFTPVSWKELDWSSKAAQEMWRDALAHGVGNQGYSVPVRGPNGQFAVFTLNDTAEDADWAAFIDKNGHELVLLAHEFNKKALLFEEFEGPILQPNLSPRELDAMRCLAQGMSRSQAAQTLAISEHTLRVYIESARHKLGAMNTTHAVARALSTGAVIV
ncbi:MAG: LuxR family transcriptional regulator [Rhodobacterales bacterium]|nr:MAG: LuxR family transcriptional regulator [Rhodobacterales bacterium]